MNAAHRVLAARAAKGYTIKLRFADGLAGIVSLENLLDIGAFKLLRDLAAFRAVYVEPETGSVAWPAGVRLDPEILYADISAGGGVKAIAPIEDSQFAKFMALTVLPKARASTPRQPAPAAKVSPATAEDETTIARALAVLKARIAGAGERYQVNGPGSVQTYVRMRLGELEREVFLVVFLDSQLRAFAIEELFQGTLAQTAVYPREIVRAALKHNAGAVVLVHNHPSGAANFSKADLEITETIRGALRLIDVTVADHLLVAGNQVASYATMMYLQDAEARSEWERKDKERRARQSTAARATWARRRAKRARVLVEPIKRAPRRPGGTRKGGRA